MKVPDFLAPIQTYILAKWNEADPKKKGLFLAFSALKLIAVVYFVILSHNSGIPSSLANSRIAAMVSQDLYRIVEGPPIECPENSPPIVILYRGKTSTGDSWSSADWAGFGQGPRTVLMNRADGAIVNKTCPVKCRFTGEQRRIKEAEAVLVETTAHEKSMGRYPSPFPWPLRRPGQLWAMFNFEPDSAFPYYTPMNKNFAKKFDVIMAPHADADIPLTSICQWGFPKEQFLYPAPTKTPGNVLLTYSAKFPPGYQTIVDEIIAGMDGASFITWNRDAFEHEMDIKERVKFTGTFKFILVAEASIEQDWITAEFSLAFLSGTVPVYIGAPNIQEYTPGPKSIIDIRDYPNVQTLVEYLWFLDKNPDEYNRYFDWKKNGLSQSFKQKLSQCFHHAECRLCQIVHQRSTCRRKVDLGGE